MLSVAGRVASARGDDTERGPWVGIGRSRWRRHRRAANLAGGPGGGKRGFPVGRRRMRSGRPARLPRPAPQGPLLPPGQRLDPTPQSGVGGPLRQGAPGTPGARPLDGPAAKYSSAIFSVSTGSTPDRAGGVGCGHRRPTGTAAGGALWSGARSAAAKGCGSSSRTQAPAAASATSQA